MPPVQPHDPMHTVMNNNNLNFPNANPIYTITDGMDNNSNMIRNMNNNISPMGKAPGGGEMPFGVNNIQPPPPLPQQQAQRPPQPPPPPPMIDHHNGLNSASILKHDSILESFGTVQNNQLFHTGLLPPPPPINNNTNNNNNLPPLPQETAVFDEAIINDGIPKGVIKTEVIPNLNTAYNGQPDDLFNINPPPPNTLIVYKI